jgi:sugar lactone lactonase YvrE
MAMTRLEQQNRIDARLRPAFWRLEMLRNDWMKGWIQRSAWLTALLLVAFAITVEAQTVPSIVVSSTTTINSAGVSAAGKVVQDTCGNFYELENGGNLLEIPANGGAAIYLSSPGSHNSGDGMTGGLAIDGSNNLYVGNKWSADVFTIPSVNCVPNPSQSTFVLNANGGGALQGLGNYWYDPADITTDSAGDVFVNSRSGGSDSGGIYEQTPAGAVALVMGNDSGIGQITSLAVDSSGDVFFTVGNGNVYEVPVKSYGTSSPTAVITSGLTTAIGIAFDAVGNMYVGDSSNGNVYVVPFTTSGTSTTPALQFGSKFLFAQGLPLGGPLTMGSDRKSILFSNFGASIYQQIPGSANFGSIAVGSSGSATVNFQFNAATTVASISVASGGGFSNAGTGTCTAKAYAAGSSCTVNVSFAPGTPSAASGSVVLADASNNVLATAYLQGTGLGAGIAMDPGSVSSVGSGFGAPASIAVTSKGEYIADTNKNAVLFFATPSSAAVSYGSGLSKPAGVAVDGAGNLIIADTGNNRIVEVPVINGALSNAAQVVLVSATTSIAGSVLNAPA